MSTLLASAGMSWRSCTAGTARKASAKLSFEQIGFEQVAFAQMPQAHAATPAAAVLTDVLTDDVWAANPSGTAVRPRYAGIRPRGTPPV